MNFPQLTVCGCDSLLMLCGYRKYLYFYAALLIYTKPNQIVQLNKYLREIRDNLKGQDDNLANLVDKSQKAEPVEDRSCVIS